MGLGVVSLKSCCSVVIFMVRCFEVVSVVVIILFFVTGNVVVFVLGISYVGK